MFKVSTMPIDFVINAAEVDDKSDHKLNDNAK